MFGMFIVYGFTTVSRSVDTPFPSLIFLTILLLLITSPSQLDDIGFSWGEDQEDGPQRNDQFKRKLTTDVNLSSLRHSHSLLLLISLHSPLAHSPIKTRRRLLHQSMKGTVPPHPSLPVPSPDFHFFFLSQRKPKMRFPKFLSKRYPSLPSLPLTRFPSLVMLRPPQSFPPLSLLLS